VPGICKTCNESLVCNRISAAKNTILLYSSLLLCIVWNSSTVSIELVQMRRCCGIKVGSDVSHARAKAMLIASRKKTLLGWGVSGIGEQKPRSSEGQ